MTAVQYRNTIATALRTAGIKCSFPKKMRAENPYSTISHLDICMKKEYFDEKLILSVIEQFGDDVWISQKPHHFSPFAIITCAGTKKAKPTFLPMYD